MPGMFNNINDLLLAHLIIYDLDKQVPDVIESKELGLSGNPVIGGIHVNRLLKIL